MGTFEKGILGGFSGKVGTVVGVYWRGKNVMRSLPRQRFKTVISFLTPIKAALSACFGKKQGEVAVQSGHG